MIFLWVPDETRDLSTQNVKQIKSNSTIPGALPSCPGACHRLQIIGKCCPCCFNFLWLALIDSCMIWSVGCLWQASCMRCTSFWPDMDLRRCNGSPHAHSCACIFVFLGNIKFDICNRIMCHTLGTVHSLKQETNLRLKSVILLLKQRRCRCKT